MAKVLCGSARTLGPHYANVNVNRRTRFGERRVAIAGEGRAGALFGAFAHQALEPASTSSCHALTIGLTGRIGEPSEPARGVRGQEEQMRLLSGARGLAG